MIRKMTFTATGNNTCIWGSKKTAYDFSEDMADAVNADSKLVYNTESVQGAGVGTKIPGTELLSGIPYSITSKFNGKSLDLKDGETKDGTQIQQWTFTGGSHQEWRLTAVGDTYCKILSMKDESKCIGIDGSDAADGLNVTLQTYTGTDNQLFRIVQDGAFYGIVSKCSENKSGLDVYSWSEENGGVIHQWNYWKGDCQTWKITPVCPTVTNGNYTIRNLNSNLFLSAKDDNVIQSTETTWNITSQTDGTYIIQNENGKALTVDNGSSDDGANISLADATGTDAQKFRLYCNADGSYTLLSAVSDGKSCADVYEISLEDGANICQWNYWGGNGQKFILEPAASKKIIGDVNADGKFSIADAVLLQKWLLAVPDAVLADIKAGDINDDERLNIFDLCLMKQMLTQK